MKAKLPSTEWPPSARLVEIAPDYPVIEISHPTCRARIALHGAHVMSWQPDGEGEVLYLSPQAVFREGKAIRGGIPICWPWFNAHPSDAEAPSHGIARTRFWDLLEVSEDAHGVTLKFAMNEGIWHAVATIKAGEALEVVLETVNSNEIPIVVSGALHTYFAVSDIEQVRVVNLEGSKYLDTTVNPAAQKEQQGAVVFRSEVDSIYTHTGRALLVDDVLSRTLLIEKSGSPSTVVWNPGPEKAAALGDMPDDDYRHFCCVEAAIANDVAEIVMPGASHLLMQRLSMEE